MHYFGAAVFLFAALECLSIVLAVHWWGAGLTLLWMLATFFAGAWMLRNSGVSALLMAAAAVRNGRQVSWYQLLWPIRYTLAAVLLVSPGIFSDFIGLILLLPLRGKPIDRPTGQSGSFGAFSQTFGTDAGRRDDIIEGEYTVRPDTTAADRADASNHRLPPQD